MSDLWLDWTTHYPLLNGYTNGPFTQPCLGWVLHVNVGDTSNTFYENNSAGVTPTIQVRANGEVIQYLPLNWQPSAQVDGNKNYAAVETSGYPDKPLTGEQLLALGRFTADFHTFMNMPLQIARSPSERGIGIHSMGGIAWGGHSCPGDIRAGQRSIILEIAKSRLYPTKGKIMAHFAGTANGRYLVFDSGSILKINNNNDAAVLAQVFNIANIDRVTTNEGTVTAAINLLTKKQP